MLKINPDLPIEPEVLAVLGHVQAAAAAVASQYLLIGAKAIDIQLHNVHGLPAYRPTRDADFAVALESWEQFEALKSALAATGLFKADPRRAQRLEYAGGFPVDLVPFGGLESPRGTIAWPPDASQVMTVMGFAEINSAAEEISVPGRPLPLRAASLPGLAVLKVFAWNDRYEPRDAHDLAALLQNYHHAAGDERLYREEALLKSMEYDMTKAGAALLGKDAAAILGATALSAARAILTGGKKDSLTAGIAAGLSAVDPDSRISAAETLLAAFLSAFR
jgi:predicted nucleotidyltransferase